MNTYNSKKPRRSRRIRSKVKSSSLQSPSSRNSNSNSVNKKSRSKKKRKASSSNSSNSNNNSQSKKRKSTSTHSWKVGDKVRPLGMPTHYIIKRSVNKNTWEMEHFDGRYSDLIPKAVENPQSGWSKL